MPLALCANRRLPNVLVRFQVHAQIILVAQLLVANEAGGVQLRVGLLLVDGARGGRRGRQGLFHGQCVGGRRHHVAHRTGAGRQVGHFDVVAVAQRHGAAESRRHRTKASRRMLHVQRHGQLHILGHQRQLAQVVVRVDGRGPIFGGGAQAFGDSVDFACVGHARFAALRLDVEEAL